MSELWNKLALGTFSQGKMNIVVMPNKSYGRWNLHAICLNFDEIINEGSVKIPRIMQHIQ